ncbi:MAG TPA: FAD-dependent oxidoreductase [Thermoanaerobaculia bacterium]|nr:FAD-dependent oxidoreductase [Thermoanaerobaculia bacterium]
MNPLRTTACIAGGGPAGMMLGFLLARAGVEVLVLEKHADFFRDFRGDTVHPSTLELMAELGLLEEFLKVPHQELHTLKLTIEDRDYPGPDFSHLPTRCKFIALMPQWDFLNFLADHAKRYPAFHLRMKAEVTGLIEEGGRIVGVKVKTEEGELEVRADLVVGTDGRHSTVREQARMDVEDFGVPIDVLWFRVPKSADDPTPSLGRIRNGKMLVTIDRGDYFQCASIIRKGAFEEIQRQGLEAFRAGIASAAPFLADSLGEVDDWDKVKLLTVQVNRLRKWYRPGLLCIGDAAHAMSPAGGVGINLAVQDAVATANLLAAKLKQGNVTENDLRAVQKRREMPVRRIQAGQVFIHRRMFGPGGKVFALSWPVRKLIALLAPILRRVAARVVGMGFRPEHIQTPEVRR